METCCCCFNALMVWRLVRPSSCFVGSFQERAKQYAASRASTLKTTCFPHIPWYISMRSPKHSMHLLQLQLIWHILEPTVAPPVKSFAQRRTSLSTWAIVMFTRAKILLSDRHFGWWEIPNLLFTWPRNKIWKLWQLWTFIVYFNALFCFPLAMISTCRKTIFGCKTRHADGAHMRSGDNPRHYSNGCVRERHS